MVVNSSSPIKSVADLVTYAKANADKMNYSSSSATFQLVTELFKQKTGAPMQMIPYKSANEMVLAVVSGQVTTTIADTGPVSPQIKAGTVRALAVTSAKRVADFPDLPTMKEAGANVEAMIWTGVFAPKATPSAIVKKLEGEFVKIARMPEVASRLKAIGVDAVGTSTDEFTKILQDDINRWGEVVKASNIKIEQ
jgi:tripartite-type tricarboxylate transporter receptor subunit TctC